MGAAAHWASEKSDIDSNIRRKLVSLGLLDEKALEEIRKKEKSLGELREKNGEIESEFWKKIKPYMPIRKLTEEEWKAYQEKKKKKRLAERKLDPRLIHPPMVHDNEEKERS